MWKTVWPASALQLNTQQAHRIVKQLDALIEPQLASDPALLVKWKATKRFSGKAPGVTTATTDSGSGGVSSATTPVATPSVTPVAPASATALVTPAPAANAPTAGSSSAAGGAPTA